MMTEDGNLLVPARAESAGVIGDGVVEIAPDHPDYARWLSFVDSAPLYALAAMRVEREPDLLPHREVILYEWLEGDEHWQWVIDAPLAEIVEWAESVGREGR